MNDQAIYILSIFDPTNYGNRLQACALEATVASISSKEVISIDSRRPKRKRGFVKCLADLRRTMIELRKISPARRRLFGSFQRNWCARVVEVPEDEISHIDGPIVIGSDQCWNPSWGLGSCEFGAQCASGVERKVAYAASFGIRLQDMPTSWRERYAVWLNEIDRIGVREFAGAEIVRALTTVEAKVVLDPTMLMKAEWWAKLEKRPCIKHVDLGCGFCLKYVLGNDESSAAIAQRCAREGLELIDLTDPHLAVGPSEFVWLVHHSSLVCTDSFHATVFSLLFHKRFVVYERRGNATNMSSRFDTLDELFGIDGNRSCLSSFNEGAVDNRDWNLFEQRLETYRLDSLSWLRESLKMIQGL